MSYKIKYIFTSLLILLISGFSCKENSGNNVSANIAIKWINFSEGFKSIEPQKKPALMFFYTEWCIYCKKMDSEVFSDPEISQYMNENFISIRINPEKESETIEIMGKKVTPAQLMAYTGSRGFPTTLFFDSKKKPVTTLPGFVDRKTFLSVLKYIKGECYEEKVSFDDYTKNPDICRAKRG